MKHLTAGYQVLCGSIVLSVLYYFCENWLPLIKTIFDIACNVGHFQQYRQHIAVSFWKIFITTYSLPTLFLSPQTAVRFLKKFKKTWNWSRSFSQLLFVKFTEIMKSFPSELWITNHKIRKLEVFLKDLPFLFTYWVLKVSA